MNTADHDHSHLPDNAGDWLLPLARTAIAEEIGADPGLRGDVPAPMPDWLGSQGATFVTLSQMANCGCIGSLLAHRPLVDDLRDNAVTSAIHDHRFPPWQRRSTRCGYRSVGAGAEPTDSRAGRNLKASYTPASTASSHQNCAAPHSSPKCEQLPDPALPRPARAERSLANVDWSPIGLPLSDTR